MGTGCSEAEFCGGKRVCVSLVSLHACFMPYIPPIVVAGRKIGDEIVRWRTFSLQIPFFCTTSRRSGAAPDCVEFCVPHLVSPY